MRISISAQSAASVPPAPAWMLRIAPVAVVWTAQRQQELAPVRSAAIRFGVSGDPSAMPVSSSSEPAPAVQVILHLQGQVIPDGHRLAQLRQGAHNLRSSAGRPRSMGRRLSPQVLPSCACFAGMSKTPPEQVNALAQLF